MGKKLRNPRGDVLPRKWSPRFWEDIDGRHPLPREIKRRVRVLCQDTGADSEQKRLIAERAVFLSLQLETAEISAVRDGRLDPGTYAQAVNSLLGCLKALGLERKAKRIGIREYVAGKKKDGGD